MEILNGIKWIERESCLWSKVSDLNYPADTVQQEFYMTVSQFEMAVEQEFEMQWPTVSQVVYYIGCHNPPVRNGIFDC